MNCVDFSVCERSDRDMKYGGHAGQKKGIIFNNEYWFLKFGKTTGSMRGVSISYTTSPLSEYVGSQIYKIMGYDVHDTIIGTLDNKVVVACKDFQKNMADLIEFDKLLNAYHPVLSDDLEKLDKLNSSMYLTPIEIVQLHIHKNPLLSDIQGVEERFWDMVVVDGLINNNDRNAGNWGILNEDGKYRLAPIYDNGAAFSNKYSDETIEAKLQDKEKMLSSAYNTITCFSINNKQLFYKDILQLDYEKLKEAIIKNTLLYKERKSAIDCLIDDIPEYINGIKCCSSIRKEYYKKSIETRFENILENVYRQYAEEKYNQDDYTF